MDMTFILHYSKLAEVEIQLLTNFKHKLHEDPKSMLVCWLVIPDR